jgi:hypothetical protein
LLLTQQELCEANLVPVLKMLRPDWRIEDETAQIRSTLLQCKRSRTATSRQEVDMLVAQLAHEEFRVRQRADRELRARGRDVLCYLKDVDRSELDAEQRLRVESIQEAVAADIEDTPARVAAWLCNDRLLWLALLNADDPQHRATASRELARLCEHPIDFDPLASQAVRNEQVANLQAKLLRR